MAWILKNKRHGVWRWIIRFQKAVTWNIHRLVRLFFQRGKGTLIKKRSWQTSASATWKNVSFCEKLQRICIAGSFPRKISNWKRWWWKSGWKVQLWPPKERMLVWNLLSSNNRLVLNKRDKTVQTWTNDRRMYNLVYFTVEFSMDVLTKMNWFQ